MRATLKRELILAGSLIGFGVFILPASVYVVGRAVVGEYPADGGVLALTLNIWADIASGGLTALVLILSPYGIVQFLRLARRLWRG